nr:tail fiber domain-containing protein [Porticoccaceae bacterium]
PAPNLTPPTPTALPTGPAPDMNVQAAQGITAGMQGSQAGMNFNPGQVTSGQIAGKDLSAYNNPYQQQVIDKSIADINRNALNTQNQLGASASAAGSFGGSRHGIAEGELGRNTMQQIADTTSQMRHQGYENSQLAANQDIQNMLNADQFNVSSGLQGAQHNLNSAAQLGNMANLGFGMGQTVTGNMMDQGNQQQVMAQAQIDAASAMGDEFQAHPTDNLQLASQAIGATPMPTTTTQSNDPGLIDFLTVGAMAMGSDRRLKTNIKKVGKLKSGLNIYQWDWKQGAEKLGANLGHTIGVIAQEVKEIFPEAVVTMDSGYYAVKYAEIR